MDGLESPELKRLEGVFDLALRDGVVGIASHDGEAESGLMERDRVPWISGMLALELVVVVSPEVAIGDLDMGREMG